jgi:hypothetical protein
LVEVRRADKGDVDTKVAVVRRAVETQIDAKGDRSPGGVVLAAVEAGLVEQDLLAEAGASVLSIQVSTNLVR